MKSKTVFLALILFSFQASAEWELVDETNNEKIYIDMSTKRREGGYTIVWMMFDYAKTQTVAGDKYKSYKSLHVFKCNEMRYGSKTDIFYSDNMGKGDYLGKSEMEGGGVKYNDVVPDTVGEYILNLVCKS